MNQVNIISSSDNETAAFINGDIWGIDNEHFFDQPRQDNTVSTSHANASVSVNNGDVGECNCDNCVQAILTALHRMHEKERKGISSDDELSSDDDEDESNEQSEPNQTNENWHAQHGDGLRMIFRNYR